MSARGPLSLGHLTFVDLAPPALVGVAAAGGFGAVGLRLAPARDGEAPWPMLGEAAPMLRATRARLEAHGLGVLDVEVVRLTPDVDVAAYAAFLTTAAGLGARYAVVSGFDEDAWRTAERFAALCALAEPFGVRPMLEPMAYSAVRSTAQAAAIVERSGSAYGGVLVDTIHLARTGGGPRDVAALAPGRLGYVQVNDAPAAPPAGGLDAIAAESRHDRLPPGEGELPLRAVLAELPPGAPVSVEAPSARLRAALGDDGLARRLHAATTAALATT
jgi:sugar phosphate isomerase/epimerase